MTRWTLYLLAAWMMWAASGCSSPSFIDNDANDIEPSSDPLPCPFGEECRDNYQKFYYVKILDQSDPTTGRPTEAGAHIDAVQLKKPTGEVYFVQNVVEYEIMSGVDVSAEAAQEDHIKGEPTAFAAEGEDFNTANSRSKCSLDESHALGLGSPGGFVVFDFGNVPVENGDTLTVYELGNCNGNADYAGKTNAVMVQVSVGKTLNERWETVLSFRAGPVMKGEVTGLPQVEVYD